MPFRIKENIEQRIACDLPVLSLKIRPDTSAAVWEDAFALLAKGGAMPSFLNDELYIQGLRKAGYSAEEANTFANVGCYEAVPYGNTFGATTCFAWRLPEEFVHFFQNAQSYDSFEDFVEGWHSYLTERYLNDNLPLNRKWWNEVAYPSSASTFSGCFLDGCVEKLLLPEQRGAKNNMFGVDLGGLGTIVDSLLCIKHFVYETKRWTLDFLREQVAGNHPDTEVLSEIRGYPFRFGSFETESTNFAAKEAEFLHELIADHPFAENVKSSPALFCFADDIMGTEQLGATLDGRRSGDRYSYGASAGELLPHRDITKVLRSTASLPLVLFHNGAPQTVNLMSELLQTEKGKAVVRNMVETYFREGGTHLQINVANPDVLRDAQKNPQLYTDLLIRISGHTEPFIRLGKKCKML